MLVTKLPPVSMSSYSSNPAIHLHPGMCKPCDEVELKDCFLLHGEHALTLFSFISEIESMSFWAHFLSLNYTSGLV
jgi:hypothetical protein